MTDKMELIWKDALVEYSRYYNENVQNRARKTTKIKILSRNSR